MSCNVKGSFRKDTYGQKKGKPMAGATGKKLGRKK